MPEDRLPATLADAIDEIERLRTLVEASKLINSSIDDEKLFDAILQVAQRELEVERGTLYFLDRQKNEIWSKIASGMESAEIRLPVGRGLAGTVAATGEPVILNDAYSDPRFDHTSDVRSGFVTRSMLCVPIRNRAKVTVGVLQLLNKRSGEFGRRDLDFLESLSENMAIAMENAMLHRSEVEKNRMERELQLGREIQSRLLPPAPDDIPGLEVAATSVSCYEVGGDYYDFIRFDSGEVGLTIADVSGKGVAAAMIMTSVQAALRMAAPVLRDLPRLVDRLNTLLYRTAGGRKYVTFFYGIYDPATGVLRYVNGGHNPPLVCTDGGFVRLESTGKPVGLFPTATFEEASVTLEPGATLVLYTDGFVEAENPAGDEFGMARWSDAALRSHSRPVSEIPAALIREIKTYENGAMPTDDKTIMIVRRKA